MAIASITEWLKKDNRSYQHGKVLYLQYGDKEHLKALFNSGNSGFHFDKLQNALEDLNKLNSPPPKQIITASPPKPEVLEKKATLDYRDYPEKIQEIYAAKNKSYALARNYFETIRFMDSQEHRREAGKELLAEMAFVQDCWQAIDEWKDNGRIREMKMKNIIFDVEALTITELLAASKNLPPNISKDKTKLASCTDPKFQLKLDNRIKERTQELNEVKRRLSELV